MFAAQLEPAAEVWRPLPDPSSDAHQLQTHDGGRAHVLCGPPNGYQICLVLPQPRQLHPNVVGEQMSSVASEVVAVVSWVRRVLV